MMPSMRRSLQHTALTEALATAITRFQDPRQIAATSERSDVGRWRVLRAGLGTAELREPACMGRLHVHVRPTTSSWCGRAATA